jgi:hypothetical protein
MAVTAVTITSGPTVVGRSVTVSGTLNRDGGGTNNTLNFLSYTVGYVSVYTITRLSDSATFLNAAGTAESGIAWTWTGTLPEGNYLGVSISLNDAPYTTFVTSANVGVVELRKPLAGIWTPNRDSRGLFVPKTPTYPSFAGNSRDYDKAKSFFYPIPNGIYCSNTDYIERLGEYGGIAKGVATQYGLGIDTPRNWEKKGPWGSSTSLGTTVLVSVFSLYNASKYLSPADFEPWPAVLGESRAKGIGYEFISVAAWYKNESGEQALRINPSSYGDGLNNFYINGVGNGLHCLVLCYTRDGGASGVRAFLNGQLVATGPSTYDGFWGHRPYYYWGNLSQSDLNMGNVHFNGHITNLNLTDDQAAQLSTDPYRQFFIDAPKTSAKRRLFGGVLSLPDPPTEFTSTKVARVQPRVLTQQPQGAVQIDWSHPLARGITFAQIGNQTQEVVFNTSPARISFGSLNSRIDQYGRGLNLAGTNGFVYPNQSKYFPTTQVSVLSITRPPNGVANDTGQYIFGRVTPSGVQVWGLEFYVSSFGTHGFTWNVRNSGGFSYSTAAALGDNYQYTRPLVVSASAGTNQSGKIYVDGTLKGTQTPLNDTLYAPGSAVGLGIGTDGMMPTYEGSTFLNVVWNRTLTDSEHLQLAQNPWQLFKPNPGRLYFLPATTTQFKGGRFLAQRWKTQPRGALTIDRGHSLSRGLCAAWHPAAQQYIGPGIAPSPTGTYAYQADPSGAIGVKFNGATPSRIVLPRGSAGFAADYSGTRLVLFRYTGTNGLVNGINLVSTTGTSTLGMRMNGPGLLFLVAASSVVVGQGNVPASSFPTVALCTANQATTETRLHINGQLAFSGTGSYAASDAGLWVGAITNHNSDSNFFLALSWDRALSIPEATAIQENPWQIFKPNPGRIYFLPGATKRGKFLFLFS